jgi:hypothetical protein
MSKRSSERSSREVLPQGELISSQIKGFDSAQAEAEYQFAQHKKRQEEIDWGERELRLQPPGDFLQVQTELTSNQTAAKEKAEAEIARKKKADAEKTLLQEKNELQEKYDKVMKQNKYYSDIIDKHSEKDEELRALIAELRDHIAEHCPKTSGGQRKPKSKKSKKSKKRKYKRSKHRHTKKPN